MTSSSQPLTWGSVPSQVWAEESAAVAVTAARARTTGAPHRAMKAATESLRATPRSPDRDAADGWSAVATHRGDP